MFLCLLNVFPSNPYIYLLLAFAKSFVVMIVTPFFSIFLRGCMYTQCGQSPLLHIWIAGSCVFITNRTLVYIFIFSEFLCNCLTHFPYFLNQLHFILFYSFQSFFSILQFTRGFCFYSRQASESVLYNRFSQIWQVSRFYNLYTVQEQQKGNFRSVVNTQETSRDT